MIIGLTSFIASGKSTFCKYLEKKGFEVLSCSDLLREECKKRNLKLTRDNLQNIGNELRKEYGADVLAKRLSEKINLDLNKNYVIDSIRTPAEIKEFKKLPKFKLIFIDTDPKIRYLRAKERLKEKEHIESYNDFIISEKKESTNNPYFQQLHKCLKLADFKINNNLTVEDFKKEISNLLVKLQIEFRDKPDWHRYFLDIAEVVSRRSSCLSAHVGAVIVKDNNIISTGYNGAPRGTKDCYQKGYCLRRKLNVPSGQGYELSSAVHAEQNAIINAARQGVSIIDSTIYLFVLVTYEGVNKISDAFPCFLCKKFIINAGITRFVGQTANGSYKVYEVKDWVNEWKKKDLVDDKVKYKVNYN
jgi:dCMP deaminase